MGRPGGGKPHTATTHHRRVRRTIHDAPRTRTKAVLPNLFDSITTVLGDIPQLNQSIA